jgi:hypothetical protein
MDAIAKYTTDHKTPGLFAGEKLAVGLNSGRII